MPQTRFTALAAAFAIASAAPLAAQSVEALDRIVDASAKPAEGLAMAQSQVSSGALLEAIATLDRVLASDPKHKAAKLLRASLLCRVDDRSGAAVAFTRLKEKDYKKADWETALEPCKGKTGASQ
jgi:thioredoxin-like negative regulator of GroEL